MGTSHKCVLLQDIDAHLVAFWSAGAAARDKGIQSATEQMHALEHLTSGKRMMKAEWAAWLQGAAGQAFDWREALKQINTLTLQTWAENEAKRNANSQTSA